MTCMRAVDFVECAMRGVRMRRMMMDGMDLSGDGRLPLIVVADTFNRVVFFSQGYSIGLGDRLLKVAGSI